MGTFAAAALHWTSTGEVKISFKTSSCHSLISKPSANAVNKACEQEVSELVSNDSIICWECGTKLVCSLFPVSVSYLLNLHRTNWLRMHILRINRSYSGTWFEIYVIHVRALVQWKVMWDLASVQSYIWIKIFLSTFFLNQKVEFLIDKTCWCFSSGHIFVMSKIYHTRDKNLAKSTHKCPELNSKSTG